MAQFELIDNDVADRALVEWGHWLGPCDRPYGRQSFGLFIAADLVSVAVSASTVNAKCGGWSRRDVVELARQCSSPTGRAFTRVCVRLWRELAPAIWSEKYWPVAAAVSYHDKNRHLGDVYRFDGWTRVREVRGGTTGPNAGHSRSKRIAPKAVWVYVIGEMSADERRAKAEQVAA